MIVSSSNCGFVWQSASVCGIYSYMNNSFVDSVCQTCGLEIASLARGYKYSVYNGKAVAVEGHCGIVCYQSNCVSFALRKNKLTIKGGGLSIKCLERNFAVVVGDVVSVAVDNG